MGGAVKVNDWETDKIIGAGLILVAFSAVVGTVIVTLATGSDSVLETCAKEIAIGLAGYMGRGGVEKFRKKSEESQNKETEKEGAKQDEGIS